jgi:hypothetical protein
VRVLFVLSMVLTVSTPQISWVATIEVASRDANKASLGSPASATSQIVRAAAKADKSVGFGGAAIIAGTWRLLSPTAASERAPLFAADPPNLDLASPPLAPRPPPFA